MKKSLTAAIAALTFGGAIAATAAPAQAHDYDGYYDAGRRHHSNNTGAAVAAGVVGLALGAALASSSRSGRGSAYYGSNSYYGGNSYGAGNGYYGDGYGRSRYGYSDDGDSYYSRQRYVARTCESQRWVWDPYIRERVLIRSTYAC